MNFKVRKQMSAMVDKSLYARFFRRYSELCKNSGVGTQPISTDTSKGVMVLDAVRAINKEFPEVHIIDGLSNISNGLPQRHIIKRTFVTLMMDADMDSAIIDPLDKK